MAEKSIKARVQHKHDTRKNWEKAVNFVPKDGEMIVYDVDINEEGGTFSEPRIKFGNGTEVVSDLPFCYEEISEEEIDEIYGFIGEAPVATSSIPTASTDTKGGVKVGSGLRMDGEVLNAEVTQEDVNALFEEKVDNVCVNEIDTLIPEGSILKNSYVSSDGNTKDSSFASATDYIPIDYDPETEITVRCSIYTAWSLVFADESYNVILAIDGNNAEQYGITPGQNMQTLNLTLPANAAYIRMTGNTPEEFMVRGKKTFVTEELVKVIVENNTKQREIEARVTENETKITESKNTIDKNETEISNIKTTIGDSRLLSDGMKAAIVACISRLAWTVPEGSMYLDNFVKSLGVDTWAEIKINTAINTSNGVLADSDNRRQISNFINVGNHVSIETSINTVDVYYIIGCYDAEKTYLGKAATSDGNNNIVMSTTRLFFPDGTTFIRIMFCAPYTGPTDITGRYTGNVLDVSLYDTEEIAEIFSLLLVEVTEFIGDYEVAFV